MTLHVGLGTFAPLRVERVDEVHLHRERYTLSAATAEAVNRAQREGRRIVAVGLRWCGRWSTARCRRRAMNCGHIPARQRFSFLAGFEFRLVGGLLTNFHLPQIEPADAGQRVCGA
jgi:S-adenosylmethionine:tRNA ribosyltransferase-isomerase